MVKSLREIKKFNGLEGGLVNYKKDPHHKVTSHLQEMHYLSRILKWSSLQVTVWSACDLFSLMEHEWV